MKCTNKVVSLGLVLGLVLSLSACGNKKESEFANPYPVYQDPYFSQNVKGSDSLRYLADGLCVGGLENIGTDTVSSQVAGAAGVFNMASGEIPYAQNIYDRMYPASTTKILTAYIAIEYGNLDDVVTVSENAVHLAGDSSKCNLSAGDQMTLRDLIYGLMLRSGNDAAIAIAEYISGSPEAFAELMNQEALKIGATGSHFVNPNGLPDENHYTTVYDLYLITQKALANEQFYQIFSAKEYEVHYLKADGSEASMEWTSTNPYLNETKTMPDGFVPIGGKTGTTGDAGYCLVQLSTNANGQPILSIVLKADCKSNLYMLMNEILAGYGN